MPNTSSLSPKGSAAAGALRPKQRERLIKVISGEVQEEGLGATQAIQHVLDIVRQQRIGRVGWFHDGILPALASYICRNGHETDSSLAYELCEIFIHDEFGMSEGASAFADIITGHLKDHVQCSGVSRALVHFIRNAVFRSAFIKRGGVAKLLKVYEQTSKLGPRQLRPASTTSHDTPALASQATAVASREIRQSAVSPVRQRREEIQSLMRLAAERPATVPAAPAPAATNSTNASNKAKRLSGPFASPLNISSLAASIESSAPAVADDSSLTASGKMRHGVMRYSAEDRPVSFQVDVAMSPAQAIQLSVPAIERNDEDDGSLGVSSASSLGASHSSSTSEHSTTSAASDEDSESSGVSPVEQDDRVKTSARGSSTARRVQIVPPLSQLANSSRSSEDVLVSTLAQRKQARKSMPAPVSRKQLLPALNLLALGVPGSAANPLATSPKGGDDSGRMVMSPKGSIGIPKLQLGAIQVTPGEKAVGPAAHGTRSSRRMSHRGAFAPALPALLAAAGAQSRTAVQEMKSLAFKLGETYCTQDLTVLLQYKKRLLGSPAFSKHKEEENVIDADEQIMRGTAYYRCKVDLLRVLDFIASDRRELSSIPSPINLLFQELATTYEHGVSIDDAKNALVFSVLGHLAHYNEHCAIHAIPPPPAVTGGMPKELVDVLSDEVKRSGDQQLAVSTNAAVNVFSPRVAPFVLHGDSHEDEATAAAQAAAAAAIAATRDDDGDDAAATQAALSALQASSRTKAPVAASTNEHNVTEFLLMINNRLKVYLSTLLVDDLNVPLSVLADYMIKCRTRVLASRVVAVCLSSLLRVKQTIFSEALKVDSFRLVRAVHYLLMVFDEIAVQNTSSTLNTLLLSVLFEGPKNATFLQEYATQLLINEAFASKTVSRRNGAWMLSQYRQRVIEHFRTLVAMVEREQELVLASADSVFLGVQASAARNKRLDNRRTELLGKLLEPFVMPHVGIAAQFMQQCPPHRFYSEHVAMLHFLTDLFAARCSPFVFEQSIIDAYVQHHYLEFVKLYTATGLDSRSLTLVRLHLRVLLSFAKHKTTECAQKFYQLRVMDFLVREVTSEYTITTSFVRGRGRADSVVAAPVVTEFLKQVQAAAAVRAAATPSPTHGDPMSARSSLAKRSTKAKKTPSMTGGLTLKPDVSPRDPGVSDPSTNDESGTPADDDDVLLSPKSRARRRGRKTPRKSATTLQATAAAAAAAAAAPSSTSSHQDTPANHTPTTEIDAIAALEAQIPPQPPKPEPLSQKPTVEQYKKFMIMRYEYEQWENNSSLVRRRIENLRQVMAKDSWTERGAGGSALTQSRGQLSPHDSPRGSPRIGQSPRSPAMRSPGRDRRHRIDDTGGTGSQAGSDSEQVDRLQRHSSQPQTGANAAPPLQFQLRIVPAANDSKGGQQPHRRNLTVTPAVTQAAPLVVGRGGSSGIHEKRLSRAHMEIFVQTTAGRSVLLVSAIGGNPSFVKPRGTSALRPLTAKLPYAVEDGDVVYLLDDQYGYEVVDPQYPSSSSDTEQQLQASATTTTTAQAKARMASSSPIAMLGRRDSVREPIKTTSDDGRTTPLATVSDASDADLVESRGSPAIPTRQHSLPSLQRPHVPTLKFEKQGGAETAEGPSTPSLKKRIGSLFKGNKRAGTATGGQLKPISSESDVVQGSPVSVAPLTTSAPAPIPDSRATVTSSTGGGGDESTQSKGTEDASKGGDDDDDGDESESVTAVTATGETHKKKRVRAKSHIHRPSSKTGSSPEASSPIATPATPVSVATNTPPKLITKPMLKLNIGSLGPSGLTGGSLEPVKPTASEIVSAPPVAPAAAAVPVASSATVPKLGAPGKLKLNLGGLGLSSLTSSASEPTIAVTAAGDSGAGGAGGVAAAPAADGAAAATAAAGEPGKLFALKVSAESSLANAALARNEQNLVRHVPPKQSLVILHDEDARRMYAQDRENHKLYHDTDLHALMLQLIFSMLTQANETLDPLYTAQYPLQQKKLNIPFILHQHINWPDNRNILPRLHRGLLEYGTSAYRLFKLLSTNAFNSTAYANMDRVATGGYGMVYFSQLIESPRDDDDEEDYDETSHGGSGGEDEQRKSRLTSVAVKLMAVPHSVHDRCVLHDIFTEILILEHFRADPDSCRLYDFGLDHEHYWITMKRYCGSLKEWRIRQRKPLHSNLLLYMNIYEKMLRTIYKLHGHHIIHFDIKCDNFFIEPHTLGATLEDLVAQPTNEPNFSVALGDFGESMVFQDDSDSYTVQSRGTEYIRSPEMLACANSRNVPTYDRRRRQGSTTSSDMWSLGCAFYELCTTEFLFYDGDWGAFFTRVTSTSMPLISQQRKDLLDNDQVVLDFLEYVFIRDPLRRPTIEDVIKRFGVTKRKVQRRADDGGAAGDSSLWGMIGNEDERPVEREPRIKRNLYEQQRHRDQLTQITDSLFISNAAVAQRRSELSGDRGVTHIIHVMVDRDGKYGAGTAALVRTAAAPATLTQSSVTPSATMAPGRSATMGRNASMRPATKARPVSGLGIAPGVGQFVQLNVHLPAKPVGDELLPAAMLTRLYEFARRGSVIGKVLVYSQGSMQGAAAVACALVMAEHECCFEAAHQLVERRRPGCRPSSAHAAALDVYGDRCGFDGLVAFSVPDYRCLCGSATVTLRRKLNELGVEPRPCRCDSRKASDARNDGCPSGSCAKHLAELNELYGYNADFLKWASTMTDNVARTSFAHTTEIASEWSPNAVAKLTSVSSGAIGVGAGGAGGAGGSVGAANDKSSAAASGENEVVWRTYRCRMCKFMTHAVSNRGQLELVVQYKGVVKSQQPD